MTKTSVILVCESWLHGDIADNEVFPANYCSYRKDCEILGGGVFTLVDERVHSQKFDIDVAACEAVWVKLRLENGKTVAVCCSYRPHGSTYKILGNLLKAVESVDEDYLVIAGDFNQPEMDWSISGTVSSNGGEATKEMFNTCASFGLTQMVTQPTRENNILGLFLTNTPEAVQPPVH